MTLFEFLMVAVSIVLALGLVRLVDGLGSALDAERRYWVHLAVVVYLIATHLLYWWSLWYYHEGVDWNFGFFAFVVLGALLLYFAASCQIPRDAAAIRSWKEHYFRIHRLFYLVASGFVVHVVVGLLLLRDSPFPLAFLSAAIGGLSLNLVGAFSGSERVHQVLVILVGTFILLLSVVWSAPP